MRIVAIANQKGGVGKTTTITRLAYYFAQFRNQRVLTIDLDTLGHVALSFGRLQGVKPSNLLSVLSNRFEHNSIGVMVVQL